jgi:16S rRNA (adenine1518-N6/adenine1519-N6)-dimethyltransferase
VCAVHHDKREIAFQGIASAMTVREVKRILKQYSIRPRRDAGQNFLVDEDVARKIAESSGAEGKPVVEIGPGLGIITNYLLKRAELVVGIELGEGLCDFLAERFKDRPNFILINADFLDVEIGELSNYGAQFSVVSNLPFNISKPAISRVLRLRGKIDSAVVTVQEEVAGRMMASPGTKEYGVLTVMVAYWAGIEALFSIGSNSFFPKPKVNSTTIRLTMYDEPPLRVVDERVFEMVVRGAFSQRRKMLRNALRPYLRLSAEEMSVLEKTSGIDLTRRGETLSLREFVHLSNTLTRGQTLEFQF